MGVTGLWKLIDSAGKPVPVETLENKVLAIDISIWLHQVIKGYQDNKGSSLAQAHLIGLFHRLCKLLYYRVKPVFVFDGGVPTLKRETIAKRIKSRSKLHTETERLQDLILQSLAQEKVVQQALGQNISAILASPNKQKQEEKLEKDDIFKLPALPSDITLNASTSSSYTDISSDSDSSYDEKNPRISYNHNIQAIDVTSKHFKNLPANIRHEILTDIKETRKQSSWGRLHELPAQSDDFSKFQMKRLLKRRQVQVSLEEAEKQMEGKSLTINELRGLLAEEGIVAPTEGATKRIVSDESTRFLLVKDLKKAIESATKTEIDTKCETPIKNDEKVNLEDEYETELEMAMKMSLNDSQIYCEKDYDYDNVKLNQEQRKQLKSAVNSLAKGYMIEYGGMNEDDINDLLDETFPAKDNERETCPNFQHNDRFILKGEHNTPVTKASQSDNVKHVASVQNEENKDVHKNLFESSSVQYISSDSDSDSDLEVVKNDLLSNEKSKIEIVIDLSEDPRQDDEDLFADVFGSEDVIHLTNHVEQESVTISSQNAKPKNIIQTESVVAKTIANLDSELNEIILKSSSNQNPELPPHPSEGLNAEKIAPTNNTTNEFSETKENEDNESQKELSSNKDFSIPYCKENSENEKIALNQKIVQKSIDFDLSAQLPKTNISGKSAIVEIKSPEDILKKLKEDIENASKITLDQIDLESIDSKKDSLENTKPVSSPMHKGIDIIMISDETENQNALKTPPKGLQTPTKGNQTPIDFFFETKYTIKRTPEKIAEECTPPKVKSPFFVNKTPKIKSINKTEENTKTPKALKQLFSNTETEVENNLKSNELEPLDPIAIKADILRENNTHEELVDIATELSNEKRSLERERNKQDRMGSSITDKMSRECMNLLKLFGIPYIIAPMEAEAQCAFLDAINLTDGTITDDSDIWLFGGRTVYKNFFNQKKHVMEFRMENIEKTFNINRHKLIQLAILVGSDYTSGITGIGTVTALEILATFPITMQKQGEVTEHMSVLSSLRKFREWWREKKTGIKNPLRNKLKNVELTAEFPNLNVVKAYLHPTVDSNRENFSWGSPDVETIREFAKKHFGWTKSKTDEILQPVLKRLNEKKSQASIKNYFSVKSSISTKELLMSKRVQKAVEKMSADYKPEEYEPKPKTRKRATKEKQDAQMSGIRANTNTRKRQSVKSKKLNDDKNIVDTVTETEHTTDSEIPSKIIKNSLNITKADNIIPQREKNLKEMEERKEKAAEIFKNAQITKKLK